MEKFLEELRRALEEANVENIDEILATYLEHFALGHEANMTDEEIIERFDSIEDIVWNASSKKKGNKEGYNVSLDLFDFSDFEIVSSDKITGIKFDIEEEALGYVEIIERKNSIQLKSKKINSFFKKHKFDGKMIVGKNTNFDHFEIHSIDTDLNIDFKIYCNSFSLTNVSADCDELEVVAEDHLNIVNTSGDIKISYLDTPKAKISTISGDIKIEELVCDTIKLSTVSGDIIINQSNEVECECNTVSGDIKFIKGVKESFIKTSTITGKVISDGKVISKNISDVFKGFKW